MSADPPTLRILLVDDHELIRSGLAGVLGHEEGIIVVGQAATLVQGWERYAALRPDVIVSDLQLPDGTGLDLARKVRRRDRSTGIVILTMHAGDDQIFAAMGAGASGFVGKSAPASEVVRTVRHAAVAPGSFVSAGLVGAMTRRAGGGQIRLSEREHDVLLLLADGLSAAGIAGRLYLSESTAKTHIARIYQKLGATNRAQALVTAMRTGLLSALAPH